MPFQSDSQRRKFYALKNEGKMDQSTIDEWEDETPKKLPEKVASTAMSRYVANKMHGTSPKKLMSKYFKDHASKSEKAVRQPLRHKKDFKKDIGAIKKKSYWSPNEGPTGEGYTSRITYLKRELNPTRPGKNLTSRLENYKAHKDRITERTGKSAPIPPNYNRTQYEKKYKVNRLNRSSDLIQETKKADMIKEAYDQGMQAALDPEFQRMMANRDDMLTWTSKEAVSMGWIEKKIIGGINTRVRKGGTGYSKHTSDMLDKSRRHAGEQTPALKKYYFGERVQPLTRFLGAPKEERKFIREQLSIINKSLPKGKKPSSRASRMADFENEILSRDISGSTRAPLATKVDEVDRVDNIFKNFKG